MHLRSIRTDISKAGVAHHSELPYSDDHGECRTSWRFCTECLQKQRELSRDVRLK